MKAQYKFKTPIEPGEENCVFELIEDRGDRVLVRSLTYCSNFSIQPTFVYFKSDLIEV